MRRDQGSRKRLFASPQPSSDGVLGSRDCLPAPTGGVTYPYGSPKRVGREVQTGRVTPRTIAAPSADSEASAYAFLSATFSQVDGWRRSPIRLPDPGSELDIDDQQWQRMPASQLAKVGLDVATDHLWAIKTLIEARQLLTFAYRSVLRTALVGATQTVWLLAPEDRATRVKRARTLVAELYHRHGAYLDQLLKINDNDKITIRNTRLVREFVHARASQIARIREDAGEKAKWNDTDAIRNAATAAFAAQPNAAQLVEETMCEWMAGSGAAHGLVWPLLGSAGTSSHGQPDEHGRTVIEAHGSLLRIQNAYMAAFRMAEYGWQLLDERSSNTGTS